MSQPRTKEQAAATPRSKRQKRRRGHVLTRRRRVVSRVPFDVLERIELVKTGLPAAMLTDIADDMAISRDQLYATIGLVRATVNRKLRKQKLLSKDESERVMGIAQLIDQVDTIVHDSGDPERFADRDLANQLPAPVPRSVGEQPATVGHRR